jgi:hypothetical protein
MFILDILIAIVGYTTARLLLPLLSFGKVYAQPVKSGKERFNALGFRLDQNKRIEVESTMAGWIGIFLWIVVAIIVLCFVRAADKRGVQISVPAIQDVYQEIEQIGARDTYEDFRRHRLGDHRAAPWIRIALALLELPQARLGHAGHLCNPTERASSVRSATSAPQRYATVA